MNEAIKKQILYNLLIEVSQRYEEVLEHNTKILEEMRYKAIHDNLTDLYNRSFFTEQLKQALDRAKEDEYFGGVLFIDLDNFKIINDTAGHQVGDELLILIAKRLKNEVDDLGIVARFGGDEFVILIDNISKNYQESIDKLYYITQKIVNSINTDFIFNDKVYSVTLSIGIAIFSKDSDSVMDILKYADSAMYEAKKRGKNNIVLFNPMIEERLNEEYYMFDFLKKAIDEEQFVIHLQPQVDINGNIVGAEALIRWNHPQKGLLYPQDFIPFAENTKLIIPIGRWIFRKVCSILNEWRYKSIFNNLQIAINCSAIEFIERDFYDSIISTIKEYDIPSTQFSFEITESILLMNDERIRRTLKNLHNFGFKIVLDDFGTGYSSLVYLKQFPIDILKIDKTFIDEISSNKFDQSLVKAIFSVAEDFNLVVIVEGIESKEQEEMVKVIATDFFIIQGFLYAKPMPIDEFEKFVEQRSINPLLEE